MDYLSISSQKVFSDGEVENVQCACGGETIFRRAEKRYLPEHNSEREVVWRQCRTCLRQYRFVELMPYDYHKLPLSVWISHKLRDKKSEVNYVLFAVATIIWIMILFYFLTSKI